MTPIGWQLTPELTAPPLGPPQGLRPPTDVIVSDGDVVLTIDLPGLCPADVKIELDTATGAVIVRGERPAPPAQHGAQYACRERRFGRFQRSFHLPDGVDPGTITASMEHGVLSLLVPRAARPAPKRIPIMSSSPETVTETAVEAEAETERRRRFSLEGIRSELQRSPRRSPGRRRDG